MKLVKFTLHGYKRFKKASTMNVDATVVAIVGPNEAGKSSFLKALQRLRVDKPFTASSSSMELSRGEVISQEQKIIEALFLLEDSDIQAIAHVPEAAPVRWVTYYRRKDGKIWITQDGHLGRNLEPRKQAVATLQNLLTAERFVESQTSNKSVVERVRSIISKLEVETAKLPDDLIASIRQLSSSLKDVLVEADSQEIQNLPQQLLELADHEATESPSQLSANILFGRIPPILFFDEEARLLSSEYALEKATTSYPTALVNLARVAKLNLSDLSAAISSNDYGRVEELIENANLSLTENLSSIWSQAGITVRLRVDEKMLRILVRDAKTTYVPIAERSDGLRQFVALASFVTVEASEILPILLIDEAETHLHYDAQADLVQMFAKQNIAAKVIYTTHSIGCLPEDLGTGIRLIEPQGDGSSKINNWFWDTKRPGFSPLLFGMGARTLAFIPIRYALITEGASDIILLPSMLRETTGRRFLGFQVVPGLSSASEEEIALLEHESPRTVFLVDSDKGGADIRRKITRAGIPPERIFSLPDDKNEGLVIEDFINPEIYLNAINEELKRSYGSGFSFKGEDLPSVGRPNAVKEWCKDRGVEQPNKRAVAYRILEYKSMNPEKILVEAKYNTSFQNLYQNISRALIPSNM